MRVGIFDDEREWCEEAQKLILQYAKSVGIDVQVVCFLHKEEMTAYNKAPLHAIFMDIELEDKSNGIDMAVELNEMWPKCQIIYLTNYLFYATEVYQTEHINFVLKEQFKNRIEQIFDMLNYKLAQSQKRLIFSALDGNEIVFLPDEIISFERNERVTIITAVNGKYQTREKIGSIMEKLSPVDFVRCHHSCIVYLPAMKEMSKDAFLMNDGSKVLISRRYAKAVKNAFSKWAAKQML